MAREQLVFKAEDGHGGKQTFVIRKVQPENEDQHIHIYELLRIDGKTRAINHVRLHGQEFNGRLWMQTGFNREAVERVLARYFRAISVAREEAAHSY